MAVGARAHAMLGPMLQAAQGNGGRTVMAAWLDFVLRLRAAGVVLHVVAVEWPQFRERT